MTLFEKNMGKDELFGSTVDFSALRQDQLIEEGEGVYGELIRKIEYGTENGRNIVTFVFQPVESFMEDGGPFDQGAGFPHINIFEDGTVRQYFMNFVEGFKHVPDESSNFEAKGFNTSISSNIILPKWMLHRAKAIFRSGGAGYDAV